MKYLRKQVQYDGLKFQIFKDVYEPAEDSFLVADHLIVNEDDVVLDMGTGCGMIAILGAQKAKKVVATDINPHSICCARKNAEINKLASKIDIRKGDLFEPIRKSEKFSLIVFNAPYLPSTLKESRSWLNKSWAGGPSGRQIIDRFITEVPKYLEKNGRILLVQSSLSNIDETLKEFRKAELKAQVIAEKRVSFETIVLIQASHLSK